MPFGAATSPTMTTATRQPGQRRRADVDEALELVEVEPRVRHPGRPTPGQDQHGEAGKGQQDHRQCPEHARG